MGPSYPKREIPPSWLVNLTGGGWEEGETGSPPLKVVATGFEKKQANQKYLDEVSVNNAASESAHSVTFDEGTFEDSQSLPDSQDEKKIIQDQGRGFTGYYQFLLKTEPGMRHRLWLRVNTSHNIKGLALQAQAGNQWKQVGIRTQNDGSAGHFLAIYFDLPKKYVTSDHTLLRLVSKSGEEVNVYHLWMYKLEGGENQPLAQVLGFAPNQEVGQVKHGLVPKGNLWQAPLVLSQHPDEAALLIQKVGKGYLIRSELAMEDSLSLLKLLLKPETLEALDDSWPGS
jgi:hypothetical protein